MLMPYVYVPGTSPFQLTGNLATIVRSNFSLGLLCGNTLETIMCNLAMSVIIVLHKECGPVQSGVV